MPTEPVHRSIVGVDIEGFADPARTDPIRLDLCRHLRRLLTDALTDAGITRGLYTAADTGDGLLVAVEPQVSSVRLLDPLVPRLAGDLAVFNRGRPRPERLRLRVAAHLGGVLAEQASPQGDAVIHTCRLLDAPAVRACLRATDRPLAVIVSRGLHAEVVRHAYGRIDPAAWHPVIAHTKETRAPAWVHVPGDPDAPRRAGVVTPHASQPDRTSTFRIGAAATVADRLAPLPPQELPADTAVFTGRQVELARLEALLGAPASPGDAEVAMTVVIDGIGGVGKSALAIHAARRLARAGAFPDGVLYVQLHGATPGLEPADPLAALAKLLRSLGLPGHAVPHELDEAAARYRSVLADRRVLVVLDNARSAAQVRPLLPGSPTCRVLVTSRDTLALLDGAVRLQLGVLPEPDAVALLERLAGAGRVQAEPDAAARLVRACGLLPLAIQLTGARLATRPGWTLAGYAEQLVGQRRLDQLRFGDQQVRSTFEVSYQALLEEDADLARVFRVLALLESPDVGVPAAAALLDRPVADAAAALERLVDAHLLEQPAPGRYRFHDLLRLLAREHADRAEPPADQVAALARTIGFYLATVCRTDRLLRPGWHRIDHDVRDPAPHAGMDFSGRDEARAWLEAERINLVKAVVQAARLPEPHVRLAGDLAAALFAFFEVRGHWWNWEKVNRVALAAARRTGDSSAQASALDDLGVVYRRQGLYERARECHEQALALRRRHGHPHDQARSLYNLGVVLRQQGRYAEALARHEEGRAIIDRLGDRFGRARQLDGLGVVHERLGRYPQALACLQEAVGLYRELGDTYGRATGLNSLGVAHRRQGHHAAALACHKEALACHRQLGDCYGQAVALRDLGLVLLDLGRTRQARRRWEQSLTLFAELHAPEAEEVRALLTEDPGTGRTETGRTEIA